MRTYIVTVYAQGMIVTRKNIRAHTHDEAVAQATAKFGHMKKAQTDRYGKTATIGVRAAA
jgi:hypothetical protein